MNLLEDRSVDFQCVQTPMPANEDGVQCSEMGCLLGKEAKAGTFLDLYGQVDSHKQVRSCRWQCKLCTKQNPKDEKSCQTCGRQRGHEPKELAPLECEEVFT